MSDDGSAHSSGPDHPAVRRPPLHSAPPEAWKEDPDYYVPPHLTPGGRREYDRAIKAYAFDLAIEVERAGYRPLASGDDPPEYSQDTVSTAVCNLHTKIRMGVESATTAAATPAESAASSATGEDASSQDDEAGGRWGLWAVLTTAISTLGIGSIVSFLTTWWAWTLFGIFALLFAVSLLATYQQYRLTHRRRRTSTLDRRQPSR